MRHDDKEDRKFHYLRKEDKPPVGKVILSPGNVLVPNQSIAVASVVGSGIMVTLFDPVLKRGGACHFTHPMPPEGYPATALFGLPATIALLNGFNITTQRQKDRLIVGLYGGAYPSWANIRQREIARENAAVVRDVMKKKNIAISDEDIGGERGRKIVFVTGSNEIAIVKTSSVRSSDWFPPLPEN